MSESEYYPRSPLVLTAYGVGFWDAERNEVRLAHGIKPYPQRLRVFPATLEQARYYFETRAAMRAELTAYYAAPGDKGD